MWQFPSDVPLVCNYDFIHKWDLDFGFNVFLVYLPCLTIPWFAFIKVVVLSLI
jgi:hypothetical protein